MATVTLARGITLEELRRPAGDLLFAELPGGIGPPSALRPGCEVGEVDVLGEVVRHRRRLYQRRNLCDPHLALVSPEMQKLLDVLGERERVGS